MPLSQLLNHPLQPQSSRLEQHQQVVDQVRRLREEFVLGPPRSGERHLETFLSHLLRNSLHSPRRQFCSVASIWPLRDALANDLLEFRQERESRRRAISNPKQVALPK